MPAYTVRLKPQEEASILCEKIINICLWLPNEEKEKVLNYAQQILQSQKEG